METELRSLPLSLEIELSHDFENFPDLGTVKYMQKDGSQRLSIDSDLIEVKIENNEDHLNFVFTEPDGLQMNYRRPDTPNESLNIPMNNPVVSRFEKFIDNRNGEKINPKNIDPSTELPLYESSFGFSSHGLVPEYVKGGTYKDLLDYEFAKHYLSSLRSLSSNLCSIGIVLELQKKTNPSEGVDNAYDFYISSTRRIFEDIPEIIMYVKELHKGKEI